MSIPKAAKSPGQGFRGFLLFLLSRSILLSVLVLPGCGILLAPANPLTEQNIPRKTELSSVPFFAQGDDLCGPASVSMMLNHRGQSLTPAILEPLIYIPEKKGALKTEVLAVTRRYGFIPYVIQPDLVKLVQEINAGNPVLILQNLGFSWYPRWHYAVVIGYDLDRDIFILRSGKTERLELTRRRFVHYWRGSNNWGMVSISANSLPFTAEENNYLESVATLERLKKWKTVTLAYETAIRKWPHSYFAHLGAGTGNYQQRHLDKARDHYQQAVNIRPNAAVAHNNLAQTLFELGQPKIALKHARKAVSLGSESEHRYRETLKQIETVTPD